MLRKYDLEKYLVISAAMCDSCETPSEGAKAELIPSQSREAPCKVCSTIPVFFKISPSHLSKCTCDINRDHADQNFFSWARLYLPTGKQGEYDKKENHVERLELLKIEKTSFTTLREDAIYSRLLGVMTSVYNSMSYDPHGHLHVGDYFHIAARAAQSTYTIQQPLEPRHDYEYEFYERRRKMPTRDLPRLLPPKTPVHVNFSCEEIADTEGDYSLVTVIALFHTIPSIIDIFSWIYEKMTTDGILIVRGYDVSCLREVFCTDLFHYHIRDLEAKPPRMVSGYYSRKASIDILTSIGFEHVDVEIPAEGPYNEYFDIYIRR